MEAMNLLVIVSDQHNPSIFGAAGHDVVRTPNLDTLARSGSLFSAAYCASPLCVPARAALATGQYVHRIGAWDNASPYTGTPPSWGHLAGAAGVAVTTVGKLHYRSTVDDTGFPDQHLAMHVKDGVGAVRSLVRERRARSDRMLKVLAAAGPGETEYTAYDRALGAEARRWLAETGVRLRRPWVLVVGFVAPHFPWTAPQCFYDLYSEEDIELPVNGPEGLHPVLSQLRVIKGLDAVIPENTVLRARRAYFGLVSFLDAQVGEILGALADLGLAERTRIVYTSDHGEMLGEHGLWGKSVMYEGSVRVPLILSGPDQPNEVVRDRPVSHLDLFRTILEGVGVRVASADGPGWSLWDGGESDRQTGRPMSWREERPVLSEYHGGGSPVGMFMLRQGRWKLIHYVGAAPQLFDVDQDPSETEDLSQGAQAADTLRHLQRSLRALVNPEEVDARARRDQAERLSERGGASAVLGGEQFFHTPAPSAEADTAPLDRLVTGGGVW